MGLSLLYIRLGIVIGALVCPTANKSELNNI